MCVYYDHINQVHMWKCILACEIVAEKGMSVEVQYAIHAEMMSSGKSLGGKNHATMK